MNLGIAYGDFGDAKKQKELLERALVIKEKHYGPDHPQTAITLNNLSQAYKSLGDAVKAKALATRAYGIFKTYHGEEHPHTQIAKRNLKKLNDQPKPALGLSEFSLFNAASAAPQKSETGLSDAAEVNHPKQPVGSPS